MESGLWAKDAVERQMSHQERNTVRMAYIHKAEHLEARKAMMQWWSDYLEACRESYAPPYTIGKISLSHSILTNPTLWHYHHLYRRWFYIDFYQLHDENTYFIKRRQ